jgi:hypothetical protein
MPPKKKAKQKEEAVRLTALPDPSKDATAVRLGTVRYPVKVTDPRETNMFLCFEYMR